MDFCRLDAGAFAGRDLVAGGRGIGRGRSLVSPCARPAGEWRGCAEPAAETALPSAPWPRRPQLTPFMLWHHQPSLPFSRGTCSLEHLSHLLLLNDMKQAQTLAPGHTGHKVGPKGQGRSSSLFCPRGSLTRNTDPSGLCCPAGRGDHKQPCPRRVEGAVA